MLPPLLLSAAIAATTAGPTAELVLESDLRRRCPQASDWQIRELRPSQGLAKLTEETFELGVVGARSLVIEHGRDGAGHSVERRRWFVVDGRGSGLVVTRAVPARSVIEANMLEVATVDLLAQGCAPLVDPALAIGRRSLESRRSGETLCASMLGAVPAISRGATVIAHVKAGEVALQVTGVARADAEVGERIRVTRVTGPSEFWAVVIAPGEVRVDE